MSQVYRYHIPINGTIEEARHDGDTVTVKVLTVTGKKQKRKKLVRQYLQQTFALNREQAINVIRAMGFNDLL